MTLTTGIGLKACEIFNKLQFAIHDTVKLSIFLAIPINDRAYE